VNISSGNHNFRKNPYKPQQKCCLHLPKNHTFRWYNNIQSYKIFCENSNSFVSFPVAKGVFPVKGVFPLAKGCELALFSFLKKPKTFQDSPSHRILRHMHDTLNIDKNKNELHSLPVNCRMNHLSLVTLWLDNVYQIKTKVIQYSNLKTFGN